MRIERAVVAVTLAELPLVEGGLLAFTARRQELATTEPELQQRLLAQAAFGIRGRQTSG